jgi:ketosteroid isomerase-like protein
MSQDNVEKLRRAASAANKRDTSILDELLSPGVCWRAKHTGVDLIGTYQGIEEVQGFFARFSQAWEEWDWDYPELQAIGDTVIARLHLWGRGRNSGVESEQDVWQLWTFRGDKVVYFEDFAHKQEALEAAGLSD